MRQVGLFDINKDNSRFLSDSLADDIVRNRAGNSSFGIGPVNLARGPLAAYRKRAAEPDVDETNPTDTRAD